MAAMKILRTGWLLSATLILLAASPSPEPSSFVIRGARVADGTGAPLVAADVRVVGDRIAEVGVRGAPRSPRRLCTGRIHAEKHAITIEQRATDERRGKEQRDDEREHDLGTGQAGGHASRRIRCSPRSRGFSRGFESVDASRPWLDAA